MTAEIHTARLAGTWYPADAAELRAQVEAFLGEGDGGEAEVRAILVPHAGYRYSGKAAGAAYAKIGRGWWKRALILAPSHYHSFAGGAVFVGDGFETPLGVCRVDLPAARRLAASPPFVHSAAPFRREHSLEIQLPFLQVIAPSIEVVPVLLGVADDAATLAALAAGLRAFDDGETLFVVSSDFTHYGQDFDYLPFPPRDAEYVAAELRRLDFGAIEPIRRGEVDRFTRYVRETGITVCGRGPIAAFLDLAAGRLAGELVCYYTSLDVTGDYEHSVSYAALVFRPSAGTRA
jgi:AmmeMemoRadiSam system protein B